MGIPKVADSNVAVAAGTFLSSAPQMTDFSPVVIASIGGGMVALFRRGSLEIKDSLSFLFQCLFVGLVGSHLITYFLIRYVTNVHPDWILLAVAGVIGWSGDYLERARNWAIERKLK